MNSSRYSSFKFFEKEKKYTFNEKWIFVGLTLEFDKNSCIVKEIFDQSILLIKDGSQYYAFRNICPHRHNRLVSKNVSIDRIRCSYHGWSFNLQGKCIDQPLQSTKIGKCNLTKLRISVIGKLIFINLQDNHLSINDQFDRKLLSQITNLSSYMTDMHKISIQRKFNWKLMQDNLRDSLHPFFLHQRTLLKSIKFQLPGVAKNFPQSILLLKHASYGGPDAPLNNYKNDAETKFVNKWPCQNRYYNYMIYPNLHIACPNNGESFIIENYIPISASKTNVEIYYVLTKNIFSSSEKSDYFSNAVEQSSKVYDEDFRVLEKIQSSYNGVKNNFKCNLTTFDHMIKRFHDVHNLYSTSLTSRILTRIIKSYEIPLFLKNLVLKFIKNIF
jgi:phenylpropionate dioxygenase-like ring-hydroxylating dioxygenase large terminal subunit